MTPSAPDSGTVTSAVRENEAEHLEVLRLVSLGAAGMYTENGVRHQIARPERRHQGRDAIAAAAQGLIDAVPDEVVEVTKVTEANGTVAVEWVFKGTHENDAPGYPAKGEKVHLVGVSVCDMEGDLIKEERVYWDTATLLAGAGALGCMDRWVKGRARGIGLAASAWRAGGCGSRCGAGGRVRDVGQSDIGGWLPHDR